MYKKHLLLVTVMLILLSISDLIAQALSEEKEFGTAESVVTEIYRLVTFAPGNTPDWQKVKSLFIKEAIIVLRTSWDSTTIFSVEGFVNDFINFIERAEVKQTGFVEKIIRMKQMVFGDMAHILVLYEAHIPGSSRTPQQGVDSFLLIKKDNRWWIEAIANEIPTPDNPIPEELQN
jgi:hypothetical protein